MRILNFYQAYEQMTQSDHHNLKEAMKTITGTSLFTYCAWDLYLRCTIKVKSRKNFLTGISKGEDQIIQVIAQQIASPTGDLLIGTNGKFLALVKDGELEIWDDFSSEELVPGVFQITKQDFLNMTALRNDN